RVPRARGAAAHALLKESTAVFEGFETTEVDTGEARIHVRHAGSGPPLLLLHGYPETRAMANDQIAVMHALGFDRFALCGHDRGARVGYRLALDHPERVSRLAVIDV